MEHAQHSLDECVKGLDYIDEARTELSTEPLYKDLILLCHTAIFKLCACYEVTGSIALHSLMIADVFISKNAPQGHLIPTAPFELFWTTVGMVCFTLSVNFHEGVVILSDMMPAVGINDLRHERKYYKHVQMHVLAAIEWKLVFPTAIDLVEELVQGQYFQETFQSMIPRDSVNFIICFAYNEYDLLVYSSKCIAISSVAVAVRYKTRSDSFFGVFLLMSLSDVEMVDIVECSETLYQKLKRFPHYLADFVEND